jgi:hypothetical protein
MDLFDTLPELTHMGSTHDRQYIEFNGHRGTQEISVQSQRHRRDDNIGS